MLSHLKRNTWGIAARAGVALAATALVAAGSATELGAQEDRAGKEMAFSVTVPDELAATRVRKAFGAEEAMKMLAESGKLAYKGGTPVKAQLGVFIVGEHGSREQLVSRPFALEPRECTLARCTGEAAELFAQAPRFFPDSYFFPDSIFFPDTLFDEKRFPDSAFSGEFFPDSAFEKAGLEKGQVGVMIVVAPADVDLQREASVSSAIIIFGQDDDR